MSREHSGCRNPTIHRKNPCSLPVRSGVHKGINQVRECFQQGLQCRLPAQQQHGHHCLPQSPHWLLPTPPSWYQLFILAHFWITLPCCCWAAARPLQCLSPCRHHRHDAIHILSTLECSKALDRWLNLWHTVMKGTLSGLCTLHDWCLHLSSCTMSSKDPECGRGSSHQCMQLRCVVSQEAIEPRVAAAPIQWQIEHSRQAH